MDNPQTEIRYAHRAKPYSSHIEFLLDDAALSAEKGRSKQVYPLSRIERIRLSYTPKNISRLTFQCHVIAEDGNSVRFDNLDWKSLIAVEREDVAYRRFVEALVARASAANRALVLEAGCHPVRYALTSLIGCGLTSILFGIGLLFAVFGTLSLQANFTIAALAFALANYLFFWLCAFVARNRPRRFTPGAIPDNLMPPRAKA